MRRCAIDTAGATSSSERMLWPQALGLTALMNFQFETVYLKFCRIRFVVHVVRDDVDDEPYS